MDTKLKGDIAEQAAVLHALKRGWGVLKPIGDRLPYDLVFDVSGGLVKIQVKYAWFDSPSRNYVVDNRRTKTNRRLMLREAYKQSDFDFALIYIENLDLFYVFPVDVFIEYGSEIHLVEADKRQRKPRSANYRDAWDLILQKVWQYEADMQPLDSVEEAVVSEITPFGVPTNEISIVSSTQVS
ncbi:endonuclease [Chroococcidiopsis sp. CCALA 051]|uniref:group I intron-associated PD-(D/E)XK endonuclease n=1 Tax=Chroococcidiopsis sp. CCALA 051 TaxID=869949 RepID=UPI000D0D458E|nr:group I intron-associated PD-(D/E)XK endonuclease [Chroococcidiopsis sp. CCALA 051]MBE9018360.1 endonuclease [Chroococcidiopsidales cyanobacterium LEGE 13417]PSM47276.1 endonuclease [Chroococcidiopsis sp. CCALA 051]